jgi:hypothetical protein
MKTGKNYQAYRAQLETLDAAIKQVLSQKAQAEKQIIEIDSSQLEASFEKAKKQAMEWAAQGTVNYQVVMDVEVEEGEVQIPLHTAHLTKESTADLLEVIRKGVHPLIAQTRQNAIEITQFYTNT